MAIRLDDKEKKPTITVADLKATLNELMTKARAFMTSHKFMKDKERAQKLKDLSRAFLFMHRDIDKFRSVPITNPAVKFSFESFLQTYYSFVPRWRRFESELMGDPKD